MVRIGRLVRAIALVEVLAAVLITSVTVLGAVGLYAGISHMTQNTNDDSTAESLCRRGVEEAKSPGFANLVDGTTVKYYDENGGGGSTTKSSTSRFSVTTTVSSDLIEKNGSSVCASADALRTLTVVVRRLTDNSVLEQTATYLARGGV